LAVVAKVVNSSEGTGTVSTSKAILGVGIVVSLAVAGPARAGVLSYWNFNSNTGDLYNWDANFGSGSLNLEAGWTQLGLVPGSDLNTLFGDPAGDALNLKGDSNNGRSMDFLVDTAGYDSIALSFDMVRNNNGFNGNQIWYSLDGLDYSLFSTFVSPSAYDTMQFDLSSVTALNDAAQVYLRIRFNGASNNGGMNRIDNVIVSGTAIPAPGALALLGVATAMTGRRRRRRC
jgi:hypothetical protein